MECKAQGQDKVPTYITINLRKRLFWIQHSHQLFGFSLDYCDLITIYNPELVKDSKLIRITN